MYESQSLIARRIGACSWSLCAADPAELARALREVGVAQVQLALDPLLRGLWSTSQVVDELAGVGVALRSGMMRMQGEDYSSIESITLTGGVRSDAHWKDNLANAKGSARLAHALGIRLVSFHAGFLPHDRRDPLRARMLERLRALVDVFAEQGVASAFETGQESAQTLLEVLADLDRARAGVNFDPANMILYDMGNPVEALAKLAPHVLQIHVKDARRPRVRGEWGEEVAVGTGEVDWPAFFDLVKTRGIDVDLMIEREAGPERIVDMRAARRLVEERLTKNGVRA